MYEKPKIRVPKFCESEGFYTTAKKSLEMSRIRGVNTKPEVALRKVLWNIGVRYRKNVKNLPGKPDIVIRKHKLVIFVDGDYWHGYDWEVRKEKIKSNRGFWIPKIESNMQRDEMQTAQLEAMGYRVLRFWEHDIKKAFGVCVGRVLEMVNEEGDDN
jgi:DNA mismatch endonuclease, patch repair protein